MEMIYKTEYTVPGHAVDRYGRLKLSSLLFYAQEAATGHCARIGLDWDTMAAKRMFWAVIRTRVRIARLPRTGETITLETWPMPTTRVAFPRAIVARDGAGNELFQVMSLWVLMDMDSRAMILPGKSGVDVSGIARGTELPAPPSLTPAKAEHSSHRTVCFTDLDLNGHMNNTRYLDWVDDLLSSSFHQSHTAKELTLCYLNEAREGQTLQTNWGLGEDGQLQVEICREKAEDPTKTERVFAARVQFDSVL